MFNAALASMETLAHLELLAARGRVTSADDGGVQRLRADARPRALTEHLAENRDPAVRTEYVDLARFPLSDRDSA